MINNQKGFAHLLLFIIILLAIPIGVYLVLHPAIFRPKAASDSANKSFSDLDLIISNELLVKFKPDTSSNIRSKPSRPGNRTGVESIDKIAQKDNFSKIEPVFGSSETKQPTSISRPQQAQVSAAELEKWYKITLSIPGTKLMKSSKDIKDRLSLSNPYFQKLLASYKALRNNPEVERVEFNTIKHASEILPNDYYYSSAGDELWGLKKINVGAAWDRTLGSKLVVVAIVDTGIDYGHADLAENIWVNSKETPGNRIDDDDNGYVDDIRGWNFAGRNDNPDDDHGHGTHVAGTVGAVGSNDTDSSSDTGKRIVGVNQTVSLMPLKVLDSSGSGYDSDIAKAITYAANNGASVINMSLGGPGESQLLTDAMFYAYNLKVVNVVAAGNESQDAINVSPARSPYVITVASINDSDKPSCFTNFGIKIDVAAPGGDSTRCSGNGKNILSARAAKGIPSLPKLGCCYTLLQGTSMATPHVAGVVGLIKALHPDYSVEETRQILRISADDPITPDWNFNIGYGRLNAFKAVSINDPPPVAKIKSPINGNTFYKNNAIVPVKAEISGRNSNLEWKLEYGLGKEPKNWVQVLTGRNTGLNETLADLNLGNLASGEITLRVTINTPQGVVEDRVLISYDGELADGWPKKNGDALFGLLSYSNQPALVDLDNNGTLEVVVAGSLFDNHIYAYNLDGTLFSGWPVALPEPSYLQADNPAVDDLNGDGKKEIVVSYAEDAGNGFGHLIVLKSDGTTFWKKDYPNRAITTPAIYDLDGDGKKEVVYRNCGLHIYKFDGSSELPGWPVYNPGWLGCTADTTQNWEENNSPAVVKFENRSSSNIITYGGEGIWDGTDSISNLYLYNLDGSLSWKRAFPSFEGWTLGYNPNPAFTDLDGDGITDIVISSMSVNQNLPWSNLNSYTQKIFAFRFDGTDVAGFPKLFPGTKAGAPISVAALNLSGEMKLLVPGIPSFKVLDLNGNKTAGWDNTFESDLGGASAVDFDRDGVLEVALGREKWVGLSSSGGVFILNSSGNILWQREYG
ncbi:S8 family serine peptidase, partial [Candidatus Daviesbacteria bacterium]|nr:S8 family serine peptidase [Candidatus Daviesbacteria bacterium]